MFWRRHHACLARIFSCAIAAMFLKKMPLPNRIGERIKVRGYGACCGLEYSWCIVNSR